MDGRTDAAKTISLRLRRGIKIWVENFVFTIQDVGNRKFLKYSRDRLLKSNLTGRRQHGIDATLLNFTSILCASSRLVLI